eukprot:12591433-Heterocapsa_arctica.AAC.1
MADLSLRASWEKRCREGDAWPWLRPAAEELAWFPPHVVGPRPDKIGTPQTQWKAPKHLFDAVRWYFSGLVWAIPEERLAGSPTT